MRKRFFSEYIPSEAGSHVRLEGNEAHHACRVHRVTPGDEVALFNGKGAEGLFEVITVDPEPRIELRLTRRTDSDLELPVEVTLAVAPPRNERTRTLVAAVTELGVAQLLPLSTERSTVRPDVRPQATMTRWERIATAAAKQCRRNRLPLILEPACLDHVIDHVAPGHDLCLSLSPAGQAGDLREVLRSHPLGERHRILVVVGPEGGLSAGEAGSLTQAGFTECRLGRSILRVETACIAVVSAIRYEWA